MSVNVRFTLLLKKIKKTANALSKDIGVTPPTIKKIEKGETSPSGVVLTFLIEQYNVNANWLLTGNGEMFVNKNSDINNSQNITNTNGHISQITNNDNSRVTTNSSIELELLRREVEHLKKALEDKEEIIRLLKR